MYVDSHCHLSLDGLHQRIPEIRREMAAAQVDRALCICTTLEEFDTVHGLALAHDNFWCTVGVHPDNEGVQEPTLEDLSSRAMLPRVVAIGETGLDYYRLNGRSREQMAWQRERFAVHIRAARATGLPLVVHTRSASADTLDMLRDEGQGRVQGVFHCFTETQAVATAARAHLAPLYDTQYIGLTVQVDEGHEVFDAKLSTLHPLFNPPFSPTAGAAP